jgi:parallel beta-helix repeat protein
MTDRTAFERFLAERFDDVGSGRSMPEASVDELRARARASRQRPQWLALVQEPPLRSSVHVVVGSPSARMAVLVLATLLLVTLTLGAGIAGVNLLASEDRPPETLVVAQDGSGQFTTVAEAVAAARDDDTILVRPGHYVESVVVVGKDLTIMGDAEAAREDIVLEAASGVLPMDYAPASGEGAPDMDALIAAGKPYAWALLLADTETSVSHFTVIGQRVGTAVPVIGPDATATLDDLDVRITGQPSGHWLSVNWGAGSKGTLSDSEVEGWLAMGADTRVTIEDDILPRTCLVAWEPGIDLVIRRNTLHGCPYEKGIDIGDNSSMADASNTVLIEGNDIWVEDVPDDATSDGFSNGRPAIQLGGSGSITIRTNKIHDSVIGIIADVSQELALEIEGNDIYGNGVGVSGIDEFSRLASNTIHGNYTGVEIGFWADPVIEDNTITENQIGLSVSGSAAPVLTGNIICGNGVAVSSPAGISIDLSDNDDCGEVPSATTAD